MSHYVTGTRKPSLDNFAAMVRHLHVDIGWLLGMSPEEKPRD